MGNCLRLFITVIWLAVGTGRAQSVSSISIRNETEWSLRNQSYLFLTSENLSPQQAFARAHRRPLTHVTENHINLGLQPKYVWIYFRVNNVAQPKTVVLSFDRIDMHHVQCFRLRDGNIDTLALTGDALPFSSRPVQINYFAIPIPLRHQEQSEIVLLLDKRNEFISGNLRLRSPEAFIQEVRYDSAVIAFFLGVAGFIFLFNFLLWLTLNDSVHLYFMAHLAAISLYISCSLGYGFEFIWPNLIYSNSLMMTLLAGLWAGTNLFLVKRFLTITETNSRYSKHISWLAWYIIVISVIGCSIAIRQELQLPTYVLQLGEFLLVTWIIANGALLIAVFIEQIRSRNAAAYLYAVALSFLLSGSVVYVLTLFNLLNAGHYTLNWLLPGFLFEEITLAFGLTLRYNRFRQQNFDLQLSLAETRNQANARIIQTGELERQRLAADLHDDLGGTLATIRRRLYDIRQNLYDPMAAQQMDALEPLIRKSGQDLRRIAHNLMPPEFEHIGLRNALQQLVESQPDTHTRFSFVVGGQERRLPLDTALNVYRIASELVQNIQKHAEAQRAAVQLLYYDDYLSLTVEDDGIGNQAENVRGQEPGIGLKTNRLRADYIGATLWREASPGGTLVVLNVPYPATSALPHTS